MEIKKLTFSLEDEHYNKCLFHIKDENLDIQYGSVFLKKGTRIPQQGFSKHPQHEFSFVQKGKIEMLNEDGSVKGYLQTGDVVYIKALEAQAGNVLEEIRIIYVLIK